MNRKLAAGLLGLFLTMRLVPAFSIYWAKRISLPLLSVLSKAGALFSFVLLEWTAIGIGALLFFSLFQRKLRKPCIFLLLTAILGSMAAWYPLYFLPQPNDSAGHANIARLCEDLIHELNAKPEIYLPPDNLPAKFIRFPIWMDALRITGLCSFLTGEALVSPKTDPVSLPFVAIHEDMHLKGYAGEGAANIAAWEECCLRGGAYAFSARMWALRYGMGILYREAPGLYDAKLRLMHPEALRTYRESGGAYLPLDPPESLRRLQAFLGIEKALQDYEILACYLAAQYPE